MIKIASGVLKGQSLKTLNIITTRPTSERVRQSIFNILRAYPDLSKSCLEKSDVIDLFAGTGALGFEAISNGASSVIFVEMQKNAISNLKDNIHKIQEGLHKQNIECHFNLFPLDVQIGWKRLPLVDIVFCDPPYESEWVEKVLKLESEHPKLKKNGVLVIETSAQENITEEMISLAQLKIWNHKIYGDSQVFFLVKL